MAKYGEVDNDKAKAVIAGYRGMIAKEAWTAWLMLPAQTRAWIGLDDMIQDGVVFACYRALHKHDIKRDASFGTYLCGLLKNYYKCKYVDAQYAQLRCERNTVSIQSIEAQHNTRGEDYDFEQAYRLENPVEIDPLVECYAVNLFIKVYEEASSVLKQHLVRWFLRPPERTKFNMCGRRFIETSREFRELADTYQFDINDCRHIMRSPECLDALSRHVLSIPYDLDNPVPVVDRPKVVLPVRHMYGNK